MSNVIELAVQDGLRTQVQTHKVEAGLGDRSKMNGSAQADLKGNHRKKLCLRLLRERQRACVPQGQLLESHVASSTARSGENQPRSRSRICRLDELLLSKAGRFSRFVSQPEHRPLDRTYRRPTRP